MYVERIPKFLQSTFSKHRNQFSRIGYRHFRILIVALVINARKGKLVHFAGAAPKHGHRTAHARFLVSEWEAAGVVASAAWNTIQSMRPQAGEPIYLMIDDTRIKKRGKKMRASQRSGIRNPMPLFMVISS